MIINMNLIIYKIFLNKSLRMKKNNYNYNNNNK